MSSITSTIKRMLRVRADSKTSDTRTEASHRAQFVDSGPDVTPIIIDRLEHTRGNPTPRSDLVAIVLPPAHGKTYFAERYGWVDIDSAIPGQVYSATYEQVAATFTNEKNWIKGMKLLADQADNVLRILSFNKVGVILVHCEHQAYRLGIEVVGSFVLPDEIVESSVPKQDTFRRQFTLLGAAVARKLGAEQVTSRNSLENKILKRLKQTGCWVPVDTYQSRKQWERMMARWSPYDIVSSIDKGLVPEGVGYLWSTIKGQVSSGALLQSDDWVVRQMSRFGCEKVSDTVPHYERVHTGERAQGLANVVRCACEVGVDTKLIAEICMRLDGETEEYVSGAIAMACSVNASDSMIKPLLNSMLAIPRKKIVAAASRLISMSKKSNILGWNVTNADRELMFMIGHNTGHKHVGEILNITCPIRLDYADGAVLPGYLYSVDMASVRPVIKRYEHVLGWMSGIATDREGKVTIQSLISREKGLDAVMQAMAWSYLAQAAEVHSRRKEKIYIQRIEDVFTRPPECQDMSRDQISLIHEAYATKWDVSSAVSIARVATAKGGRLAQAMLEVQQHRKMAKWIRDKFKHGVRLKEAYGKVYIEGSENRIVDIAKWAAGAGIEALTRQFTIACLRAGSRWQAIDAASIDWAHWNQGARLATLNRCIRSGGVSSIIAKMWLEVIVGRTLNAQALASNAEEWEMNMAAGEPAPANIHQYLARASSGEYEDISSFDINKFKLLGHTRQIGWKPLYYVSVNSIMLMSKLEPNGSDMSLAMQIEHIGKQIWQ